MIIKTWYSPIRVTIALRGDEPAVNAVRTCEDGSAASGVDVGRLRADQTFLHHGIAVDHIFDLGLQLKQRLWVYSGVYPRRCGRA
jgi:hypothetical protein